MAIAKEKGVEGAMWKQSYADLGMHFVMAASQEP